MGISFIRSLRSLESDSAHASLAAVVVTGSLVAVWIGWVSWAPIELRESSQIWQVTREGSLIVHFPVETVAKLRSGQRAEVIVSPEAGHSSERWPAVVSDTPRRMHNRLDPDTVKIDLLSGAFPKKEAHGKIEIIVEKVTPMTLMLRASVPAATTSPPTAP